MRPVAGTKPAKGSSAVIRSSIAAPVSETSGLREAERLARGHPQLQRDEVPSRDQFGHRMLDLEPRVHFEEVEAPVGIEEELDGPGVPVPGALGQAHGRLSHRGPQFG